MAALAASLQSNRIGCATVARSAGLNRLGVPGVPGPGGGGAAPASTVKLVVGAAGANIAEIVIRVLAVTVDVATVKVAEVAPVGTDTIGCGRAIRLLVESVTVTPPAGAGLLRNTVPLMLLPPVTLGAAIDTDDRSGGAFGSGPRPMN